MRGYFSWKNKIKQNSTPPQSYKFNNQSLKKIPKKTMGNSNQNSSNPFYAASGNKQSQLAQLLQQFTFVSNFQDDLFGRCSIIQHKQTKESIITKEIICQNQSQVNKLHQDFQRRKNTLNNINLLRLRYIIKKKTEGMFSDEYKLILFFDYIVTSIQMEYQNRVKTQRSFSHEEINIITCGALRAYAALEAQNIANSKVRLSNIYFGLFNGMPIPKVIDSKLFPSLSNLNLAKRNEQTDDIFLSPQELKYLQEPNYSNPKSGVYSLAVSLLQLCLLVSSKDLYNYNKRSINYPELQNRLNIIKNKYPLSIYCLLRDMLERNEDSRPSFAKLEATLPTNLKNLPTTMSISLMKGGNNNLGQSTSKFMNSTLTNNFSKVKSPLSESRGSKRGTLTSEYRPQTQNSEVYTNGNRYQGQKKDNLRHGRGKYMYNDGSYYLGDWIKGKMQGQGQLFDSESILVYDGSWKDDHYEGSGRLLSSIDGWSKYEGEFRCGQKEGFGEIWYNDGTKYKGQFRNDLAWGKGRLFGKNGEIQNGIWQKGNFISQY